MVAVGLKGLRSTRPDAPHLIFVGLMVGASLSLAISSNVASVAVRGLSRVRFPSSAPAIDWAFGPLRRTTPMPPRPGGVAMATIVSSVLNTGWVRPLVGESWRGGALRVNHSL